MVYYNKFYVVLLLTVLGTGCLSERILFLLPLASRSHVHVFEPLMRTLGERGHDIVTLSPLQSSNMPKTVKQIQLVTVDDLFGTMLSPFEQRKIGFFKQMMNASSFDHMSVACEKALQKPEFSELLQKEKFDLVIVDISINYCFLGVIPHFNASSIFVSTVAAPPFISNVVGNRLPPSFVPSVFLQFSDQMTFVERMINTVSETVFTYLWETFIIKKAEATGRKYFPNGKNLPDISEIQGNVSMIFANSHFTLTYPRPLLPDVIEVGGMHTRPAKKLPKELDEFLIGSREDGFIFFSLGSIVKAHEMPESTRKIFINVFSRLKQRVIWKWETETMPDLPKNVKLSKWLPQQDILGHPNIRLFMSHGGLLSTQESVYHGVPVLGLPIFGDQDLNVKHAVKGGYARFVEILNLTEEELEENIHILLKSPSYSENARSLSKLVRDLPHTPLENAVFWTEYVLRHKGAPHLRSAARDLNFFQYYVLDVVVILLLSAILTLYLTYLTCKTMCNRVCGKSSSTTKNKRTKKD